MERRGLDWATLRDQHPRLIVASISGFGKGSGEATGLHAPTPMSHKTAFDLIAQAYSGLLHLTGPADGTPTPVGTSYADVMSGVHAVAGIGLALYHRERTGEAQHIDISMVDSLFHAHELAVQGPSITGGRWRAKRMGARSTLNTPQGVFPTADGHVVMQVMQGQWPGLLPGDRPAGPDRRRALRRARRTPHEQGRAERADRGVDERCADGDRARAPRARAGAVCPGARAARVDRSPVLRGARHGPRSSTIPILGEVHIPGNPLRMSAQTEEPDLVAPLLGEHNAEVLHDLGYDDAQIAAWYESGVLASAPT